MTPITFVTGTDTSVGKTVVTALLLRHLRERGVAACAMKPFSTGNRNDARLLHALQGDQFSLDEINPFHFREPVAPLVAARRCGSVIRLRDVLSRIRSVARRCEWLVVEGAGGLMSPLGERFSAFELIARLGCDVVVVAADRLGAQNQVLLTVSALRSLRLRSVKVVLSELRRGEAQSLLNAETLREWASGIGVIPLPYLGAAGCDRTAVIRVEKKLKKVLARIFESAIFTPVLSQRG